MNRAPLRSEQNREAHERLRELEKAKAEIEVEMAKKKQLLKDVHLAKLIVKREIRDLIDTGGVCPAVIDEERKKELKPLKREENDLEKDMEELERNIKTVQWEIAKLKKKLRDSRSSLVAAYSE